ncbi:MAG: 16S rRNA (guanine(966)-N(2))-methyltransferase RsmD [Cyanobacteriota bacterium]|nr:16S rRNA (guanine(966)-N(2))-methyltransferase RsmD [Cyanobacteriota bacterium]
MSLRLSGGRRLRSPSGDRARPTPSRVRLAVMNMLAPRLPGCHWLDLCSGSGVMACEVLQRGAALVVGVEQDRQIAQVARANLMAVAAGLGVQAGSWQLHCQEALQWLRRAKSSPTTEAASPEAFDLIYCDPPYAGGLYPDLAAAIAAGGWLQPDGLLLLECGSNLVPAVPDGWQHHDLRRYGSTSLLVLSCPAGCRGDTDSRRP